MRYIKPKINAAIVATPMDANIPYAPRKIKRNGRINFIRLKTVFFISMYFDCRYAIKILSDIVLSEIIIVNNTKSIAKKMFSLTNSNFGEKIWIQNRYINAIRADARTTRVKVVFIF